jgi:hypothetical protein
MRMQDLLFKIGMRLLKTYPEPVKVKRLARSLRTNNEVILSALDKVPESSSILVETDDLVPRGEWLIRLENPNIPIPKQDQTNGVTQESEETMRFAVSLRCKACGGNLNKLLAERGLCKGCFKALGQYMDLYPQQLHDLRQSQFDKVLAEYKQHLRNLKKLQEAQTLTPSKYEELRPHLITLEELLAAAKEKGYPKYWVMRAIGGDKLRQFPLAVHWTPLYYGFRQKRYFHKILLDRLSELDRIYGAAAPPEEEEEPSYA